MLSDKSGKVKNLIIISFLSVFAIYPLFNTDTFVGHDMPDHITRCEELKYSLEHGVFFPRIFPNLCYGYSTPIFNYQSPLFYYAVCFAAFFAGKITVAIKIICALCFILSGIFMYQLVRYLWNDTAGIIAGVLYIYTPYHISQIYVRSSLTEFFAVTFFPLLMLQYLKYVDERTKIRFFFLSLLNGILILSHNPMALIFPCFLCAYFLYRSFLERSFNVFLKFLKPLFTGLLLASFFWVPAINENQYIQLSRLMRGISDYYIHFVYFDQFFSPFWGYGYSIPGPFDGMSFQLGFFNIIAFIFSIFLIRRYEGNQKHLIIFLVCSFLVSVFLMMLGSHKIWDNFPLLGYIQYPWRFLALTGFISSLLMGGVVSLFFAAGNTGGSKDLYSMIVILIIFSTYNFFKGINYSSEGLLPTTPERVRYSGTTSSFRDEYLPIWVKNKPTTVFRDKVEPVDARPFISDLFVKPLDIRFSCNVVERESLLRINTFYFPGWQAYLNGGEIDIHYEDVYNGIIHLKIPQGKHHVKIWFKGTTCQQVSFWISLITLILMTAYTLYGSLIKLMRNDNEVAKLKA